MDGKIKVLVATAEPLLADGIVNAVMATNDLEVIAKPKNRTEAITLIRELQPCVAIIDCDLLEPDCFQAIREIKQVNSNLAILTLTSKTAPSRLLEHLQAGVAGYLLKTATSDEVINAIRRVCTGEAVLTLSSMYELIRHLERAADEQGRLRKGQRLHQKELEVLKLASKGLTNKEIAQKLFVSERTVQSHFGTIFGKLEVGSRTEAVLVAWRNGWIADEDLVD